MSGVPSNIVVPYVGIDFDNSRANTGSALLNFQALLFGQKTSSGTGDVGKIIRVYDADSVGKLAGFGSQVHLEAISWFKNNTATDTFIYLLSDASEATAAEYSLTVTGPATASGELDLYIGGKRIAVSVSSGDTAAAIATAIAAAISEAIDYLPVTSVSATDEVVLMAAKNAGTVANRLDVRFNYYDGEVFPDGVGCTFALESSGATDPTVTDMLSAIGDTWFNVFVGPYTDGTNLSAMQEELSDRNSAIRQIDGVYICALSDTLANLISAGTATGRNSQFVGLHGVPKFPTNDFQIAAAIAGAYAQSAANDPAKPLHRITLSGVLSPDKTERLTLLERNSLANNGIATVNVSDDGVITDATITMYHTNSAGASDMSYRQLNTMFTLMYLRYSFCNWILTRYPRAKLCSDIENIGPGQQIITPSIGRGEALAWFREMEYKGLVEDFDTFKKTMTCTRDKDNVTRLNWNLTPDLMNQFIVGSATIQFIN